MTHQDLNKDTSSNINNVSYPKDIIKDVAESIGISGISDEALTAVANDVDYKLRELIQEASKFMRHSKRTNLMVDDVNYATKVRGVETLYGYNMKDTFSFGKVTHNNQDLYFVEDKEVDLESMITAPLPPRPQEPIFTAHWLAINGKQPAIPQNPIKRDESKQAPAKRSRIGLGLRPLSGDANSNQRSSSQVEVKPLVKHVLSRELRVYFEKMASSVLDIEEKERKKAYEHLAKDTSIHQLIPYFVHFINEKVTQKLDDLTTVQAMLYVTDSLLNNKSLFVEPYLHQLLPTIISCCISKCLGVKVESSSSEVPLQSSLTHFDVRRQASHLVAKICTMYGNSYPSLKKRVVRTLLKGLLDPVLPIGAVYGAILALAALGPETVAITLVPNLPALADRIEATQDPDKEALGNINDGFKCASAVIEVLTTAAEARKEILELPLGDDEFEEVEEDVIDKVMKGKSDHHLTVEIKESRDHKLIAKFLKHKISTHAL